VNFWHQIFTNSSIEQSANPAARVGYCTGGQFRRALKTHLFGRWQLQRRLTDCFSCILHTNWLTYLIFFGGVYMSVSASAKNWQKAIDQKLI